MYDAAPSVDRKDALSPHPAGSAHAQASLRAPARQASIHYLTPFVAPATTVAPPLAYAVAQSQAKRLVDIIASTFALLMFLPLLLVIAVAVRFETRGPALFRQRRTGLNGKVFTIYKFRTMTVAEDHGDIRHATKNDARVTPLGLVLRKCSLDELPQLLNILKGDMSFVGPRPHAVSHDDFYGARIPTYNDRFRAKPGLTGLAQVSGYRGEIREMQCMVDRVQADNAYIEDWTFARDLWIMLRTVPLVLKDPNAY
ncbi:MAG TPA: sugar transferase [Phenylobacterium sp.]|nr:sugar transferase [Phenylobacterium sp.]